MASVLKVDEIQSTSAGGVLFPTRPSFFVYKAVSDATDQNYSSVTAVTFDTKRHDIGNGYDLSADTYTVPISGVYHLSWQVRLQNVQGSAYIYSPLYLNGAAHWGDSLYMYGSLEDPQGGTFQTTGLSVTVELSADDVLKLYFQVNSDTTARLNGAGTFFSGFLVG